MRYTLGFQISQRKLDSGGELLRLRAGPPLSVGLEEGKDVGSCPGRLVHSDSVILTITLK